MTSLTRFGRFIDGAVHECAPDHSTHVIEVGELRRAVREIEALYSLLFRICDQLEIGDDVHAVFLAKAHGEDALALARGETEPF